MPITLISSPLQGFTDHIFRNSFNKYFGGIDQYYAPYIRLKGKLEIKQSQINDIHPENNEKIHLVPQIMTKNVKEFQFLANYCKDLCYDEINWNLGCPYPMVTKRGLGSGQIKDINRIKQILSEVFEKIDINISIKTRLGYEDSGEVLQLLPVLNQFPLKNITIHPRIGKQLYKGNVDLDTFEKCLDLTSHKIICNGDIASLETFEKLQKRFSAIDTWMIGRGILQIPWLPMIIKGQNFKTDRLKIFRQFHDEIFESHKTRLSGDKHLILKMYQYWEYFIYSFPAKTKELKKIKKAKNLDQYLQAVDSILIN